MHLNCLSCDLRFEREQGYFVGAIYINYAVTAIILITGFFSLDYLIKPSLGLQLAVWCTVGVCFPLLFFRYSRSLWLAVDYFFSPEDAPVDRREA